MNNGSLTFEQMKEILQGMVINQKETDKIVAKLRTETEKLKAETEALRIENEKRAAEENEREEKRLVEEEKRRIEENEREEKRLAEEEKRRIEMDKRIEESSKKADKIWGKITSMWGQLVESLVEGDLIKILNDRGIPVNETSRRRRLRKEGFNYEVDIVVHDGAYIVVVEVKTTLRTDDVHDFFKVMEKIRVLMPEYHDKIIYGAMAFIHVESNCDVMLERSGLFCIKATGNSAAITNSPDFIPKAWNE